MRRVVSSPAYRKLAGFKNEYIEVTALHPLMVDETGVPAFGQRAPHPALLFRLKAD